MRFREDPEAGRQVVAILSEPADLSSVLAVAAGAAETTGLPPFLAARHRLQMRPGALGAAEDEDIAALARLGFVVTVQPASDPRELPLRRLAGAGVPLAFGSGAPSAAVAPWAAIRAASSAPRDEAVSVRAAFAAATRGGHRAARRDGVGELRAGAAATFAVWEYDGELVVRTPDTRVAAWSTDPRAATPGLPEVSATRAAPRCLRTVVDGAIVFDDGRWG
jgi:predicted amidohydrolase YtcJ